MNYKLFEEETLFQFKDYFDEIYVYFSDVMVEIENELTYGTAFIKWEGPDTHSNIFKDEKMSERLEKAYRYGDVCFSVYFEKEKEGYKKYLFIANNVSVGVTNITNIMRFYFRANRRTGGKAFNQKEIQNKFIAQYVSLYPNSIAKLYEGILSISMSDKDYRSIRIEDGESFKEIDLNFEECINLARFFTNLSNILLL